MAEKRYRTAFVERNRVVIAVLGIAVLAGSFFATFHAESLPVIGGGSEQQAYLAETAGLRAGDEVRVAGVKVGKVGKVELKKDQVLVTFRIKGVRLGDESSASVRIKTMLGKKYLAVAPLGDGRLSGPIPVERTTTPYDVNAAFSDLSTTITDIDTDQLEASLRAMSTAFADTPESVRGMVSGLSRLSRTIASRDEELGRLFESSRAVTTTVAARHTEIGALVSDGNLLLTELSNRRESIRQLFRATSRLGRQLTGLVRDNEKKLRPALAKLDKVSANLRRNQRHLDEAMAVLGPYYRMLTATMGNGRWVDSYVCGLFDADRAPVLDNDVVRDCRPGGS